jgi:hypothetical protein
VDIAGVGFNIAQAGAGCAFTLAAPATTIGPAGGTINVSVTTTSNCAWVAAAYPDWLSIPGMPAGTGSGVVAVSAAPNPLPVPRTGTMTVAGQTLQLVEQRSGTPAPAAAFSDVPLTHPYSDHITLLKQYGVTSGCSAAEYCPDAATTRGQMAVFIVRSIFGGDNFAWPAAPYFSDVPASHPFFRHIQKMRELGITTGCSPTAYCPGDPVTRGQMAVFLIRGRLGVGTGQEVPAPVNPFFGDVPASHPYFAFIQKMREISVTTGCSAADYCADSPTTRGQMAVFLVRAFFTP